AQAQLLRDKCKFGDPLYFAKRFGNGRVAVMTTDAGGTYRSPGGDKDYQWTDWPSGGGAAGWVAVMREMQKYLVGGGAEENRSVGSTLTQRFEAGRYKPSVDWVFLSADTLTKVDKGAAPLIREPAVGKKPNSLTLGTKDGAMVMDFTDTRRPGAYLFTM